jgi:hypothetical protein
MLAPLRNFDPGNRPLVRSDIGHVASLECDLPAIAAERFDQCLSLGLADIEKSDPRVLPGKGANDRFADAAAGWTAYAREVLTRGLSRFSGSSKGVPHARRELDRGRESPCNRQARRLNRPFVAVARPDEFLIAAPINQTYYRLSSVISGNIY